MRWMEPQNHISDCYFCQIRITGINHKYLDRVIYPDLETTRKALLPINVPRISERDRSRSPSSVRNLRLSTAESTCSFEFQGPQFNQSELNSLVRELGLTKDKAEILGSRLQEKGCLAPGSTFSWYRNRERKFISFFMQEGDLIYCCNINGLIEKFGIEYKSSEWRLFIDSSKTSLKIVLLHNGNQYSSIPIGHSVHMKEQYENLAIILAKIRYEDHQWLVCGDLKIISMILGQQGGFTKLPCYLCEFDSRDRANHWDTIYPPRILQEGERNILHTALVNPQNILIPPLHIKLGIMKQFVKALPKNEETFKYLKTKFPALSDAKIKEGVFVGPDIRRLMKDSTFELKMTLNEKAAWVSFRDVINNFLGNTKSPNYQRIVQTLLKNLRNLNANLSYKLHFLNAHLDHFPDNLGAFSEEHGERFHQDMKIIEYRYQGKWSCAMLADYCWSIKAERVAETKRKSCKKTWSDSD